MTKSSSKLFIIASNLKPIYHTSSKKFNQNNIIRPYWGLDKGHKSTEILFEQVRKDKFKNAPSRLNSVFCWDNYEDAIKDLESFHQMGRERYLYQVKPLNQSYPCNLYSYKNAISAQNPDEAAYWAEYYWDENINDTKEILAKNGVIITFEY